MQNRFQKKSKRDDEIQDTSVEKVGTLARNYRQNKLHNNEKLFCSVIDQQFSNTKSNEALRMSIIKRKKKNCEINFEKFYDELSSEESSCEKSDINSLLDDI